MLQLVVGFTGFLLDCLSQLLCQFQIDFEVLFLTNWNSAARQESSPASRGTCCLLCLDHVFTTAYEAFEGLNGTISGEVRRAFFWCRGAADQKAFLAQVAVDLEQVIRVVSQHTCHFGMESLGQTDVLVEFVLLSLDLRKDLISDTRIVVLINMLRDLLTFLL